MKFDFNKVIDRRGTYCTQWDFVEDRFGYKDLLPFTISDMDFCSPPPIQEALLKGVKHGIWGYSRWNHQEYLESICFWYQERFNYKVDPSWILYAPNVIYLLTRLLDILNPHKGEVFLFSPYYDGFIKVLEGNQYPYLTSPLDKGFDREDFKDKIKRSKILLLCNPNNPDGKVWSEEELTFIIETCKSYKVAIISDEIHMDFSFTEFFPLLKVAQKLDYLSEVFLITASSKTFNTAGLGGSYGLIPNREVYSHLIKIIKEKDSLSSPMIFSVLATIAGYKERDSLIWLEELRQYLENNLRMVDSFLKENLPLLKREDSQGTYFAWINTQKLDLSESQIQEKLITKGKVAIMRGKTYGSGSSHLRLNVACPSSKLEEGLRRMKISLT